MRIFKNRNFDKWAKSVALSDSSLKKAICEMIHGLYDAKLGSGLYKKRIAYGNRGKSSGNRTIIAYKQNEVAIFIYGFQKNELTDISEKNLDGLKSLAKEYLNLLPNQIKFAVNTGKLIEVIYEEINTSSST